MDKQEKTEKQDQKDQKEKKPFYKKTLGCLFVLFGGFLLFLILALALGVWIAGRSVPAIASGVIKDKAGADLVVGENNINLFAGRVDLKNIKLTNPARFHNKDFIDINQVKAEVSIPSFLTDTYHVKEVILDVKAFTFVGKGKLATEYATDNNVLDFKNAFASEDTSPKPEEKPTDKKESKPIHFKIDKLVLKLDHIKAIIGDGSNSEGTLIPDTENMFELEFTDITDENIKEKVYDKIDAVLNSKGLGALAIGTLNGIYSEATGRVIQAGEKATEVINKAGEKANEAVKGISDSIGGLLGGNKKDEKK
ncbi:MAG: hypothetical protein LBV12_01690 [Puniceicoccales bacterium]|nr:hypothetical protein [Puniceicoccales bacterium]